MDVDLIGYFVRLLSFREAILITGSGHEEA